VSFDPVFSVGAQLIEAVRQTHGVSKKAATGRRSRVARRCPTSRRRVCYETLPPRAIGGMAQRALLRELFRAGLSCSSQMSPRRARCDTSIRDPRPHRELQEEHRLAVLLVTHDMGRFATSASAVVVMYAGQVVERAELCQHISGTLSTLQPRLYSHRTHRLQPGAEWLSNDPRDLCPRQESGHRVPLAQLPDAIYGEARTA